MEVSAHTQEPKMSKRIQICKESHKWIRTQLKVKEATDKQSITTRHVRTLGRSVRGLTVILACEKRGRGSDAFPVTIVLLTQTAIL